MSPSLPAAAGGSSTHFTRPLASRTKTYVYASYEGGTVNVYSTGKTSKIVDTITQGLSDPLGIAIDKSGTLYVANNANATVTEYLAGSNSPSVTLTQGLAFPNAVAVDGAGNLWVANGTNVLEYPAGSQSPSLTLTNGINGAGGIAVNSRGTVYVSNLPSSGSPYVAVFPRGATKPKTTFGQGVLVYPCGIALDPNENVYVADFFNGVVYVFSHRNYKLLRTVSGQPYFTEPCGVTIDTRDRLYLGGGGNPDSVNLIAIRKLGHGTPRVLYEMNGLYGVAADPTIQP